MFEGTGDDASRVVEITRGIEPEVEPWRAPDAEGVGEDDKGGSISSAGGFADKPYFIGMDMALSSRN